MKLDSLIIRREIPLLKDAIMIEKLNKGYSSDEKYIIHFEASKKLLRVAVIEEYEKKKLEFNILKSLSKYDVKCSQTVEVGLLEEWEMCYTIYSYIEGAAAKEILHVLTDEVQYDIGIEAGKQLTKIHQLGAPPKVKPWYARTMAKHYRYVEAYKSSGIKIKDDKIILHFIEENKNLLKNRPNQFQHDDFHLGNIIVDNRKYAGVIDFGNFDWGDPFHDFVKLALFQREHSVPFSIGQIKGYFNDEVPEDFWMLYSIYVAMGVFSSVVWSFKFAPEQLDEMVVRVHNILEEHNNFEILKPVWFR